MKGKYKDIFLGLLFIGGVVFWLIVLPNLSFGIPHWILGLFILIIFLLWLVYVVLKLKDLD